MEAAARGDIVLVRLLLDKGSTRSISPRDCFSSISGMIRSIIAKEIY
jgi:hypothetical protein